MYKSLAEAFVYTNPIVIGVIVIVGNGGGSVATGKYPHLDVVSFGPTMCSPHTTSERCFVPSIEPFWQLLRKALEEVPVK